jgi:hypothetical protein
MSKKVWTEGGKQRVSVLEGRIKSSRGASGSPRGHDISGAGVITFFIYPTHFARSILQLIFFTLRLLPLKIIIFKEKLLKTKNKIFK